MTTTVLDAFGSPALVDERGATERIKDSGGHVSPPGDLSV